LYFDVTSARAGIIKGAVKENNAIQHYVRKVNFFQRQQWSKGGQEKALTILANFYFIQWSPSPRKM